MGTPRAPAPDRRTQTLRKQRERTNFSRTAERCSFECSLRVHIGEQFRSPNHPPNRGGRPEPGADFMHIKESPWPPWFPRLGLLRTRESSRGSRSPVGVATGSGVVTPELGRIAERIRRFRIDRNQARIKAPSRQRSVRPLPRDQFALCRFRWLGARGAEAFSRKAEACGTSLLSTEVWRKSPIGEVRPGIRGRSRFVDADVCRDRRSAWLSGSGWRLSGSVRVLSSS